MTSGASGGRLAGAVAIVSGGARGIGAATARLFVAEGARVVIGDMLVEQGRALADELGPAAACVELDVRNQESWALAVALCRDRFGPTSVLVNNAGVNFAAPIEDTPVAELRRLFEVNVVGSFLGIQAVLDPMRERGGGAIVHVASTTGLTALAGNSAYAVSKAGSAMLARSAAVELGRYGIRVNSVHPGGVDTDMRRGLSIADPDARRRWYERLPLGRIAAPEEVARTILFLASEESCLATGAQFVIDCGQLAGFTGI